LVAKLRFNQVGSIALTYGVRFHLNTETLKAGTFLAQLIVMKSRRAAASHTNSVMAAGLTIRLRKNNIYNNNYASAIHHNILRCGEWQKHNYLDIL